MKLEGIAFISYNLLARKMTVLALMDLDKSGHLFFQCRKDQRVWVCLFKQELMTLAKNRFTSYNLLVPWRYMNLVVENSEWMRKKTSFISYNPYTKFKLGTVEDWLCLLIRPRQWKIRNEWRKKLPHFVLIAIRASSRVLHILLG